MPDLPAVIYRKLFWDPVPKIIASSRWLIHSESDSILKVVKKMGLWEGVVKESHSIQLLNSLPLTYNISAVAMLVRSASLPHHRNFFPS